MSEEGMNNYIAAYQAGLVAGEHHTVEKSPYVVVPECSKIESLEKLLDNPTRKRGKLQFHELESWVHYVNTHKDGQTMLFVDARTMIFQAVLDHHSPETPGWSEHVATFMPLKTVEWARWEAANKKKFSQTEFAEFLEENLEQIIKPVGAEVLEVARRLEAQTSVEFTSATRLDNGNQEFRYEEKTEAKAGEKGTVQVPSVFKIGLVLFEGGVAYELSARLRYRIVDRALVLWFELLNPHLVVQDAVVMMIETIQSETAIKPLMGKP
jgi:uncharacterized protein YfdQ (DUF2303 family)